MASKFPYTVAKQKDGTFLVSFVDFPTGVTEGDTVAEAHAMAKDMIVGLVECYKEDGIALPVASAVGSLDFVEI